MSALLDSTRVQFNFSSGHRWSGFIVSDVYSSSSKPAVDQQYDEILADVSYGRQKCST